MTLAINGFEAVREINENLAMEPKEFFDLVILDLGMPIMDGYEACSKINTIFSLEKLSSFKRGAGESSAELKELYKHS